MKAESNPVRVSVTAADIREGVAGDCFACAVALALQRATRDAAAGIYERDYFLRLEVDGLSVVAPDEVRRFVRAFDSLPRDDAGRPELPARLPEELRPFDFEIPGGRDPEWEEGCYECEGLFAPADLDDEGYCPECREVE